MGSVWIVENSRPLAGRIAVTPLVAMHTGELADADTAYTVDHVSREKAMRWIADHVGKMTPHV